MRNYVDGFVIVLKKKNLRAYKKMAQLGRKVWMKHGAIDFFECQADEYGKWGLGFKALCKVKPSEVVIFSVITYKSKSHRNKVNRKVMSDPAMNMGGMSMPFEEQKFSMAGFKVMVQSKK